MGYVGNQTTTAFTSMAKQDITGDGGTGYTLDHAVANAQEIEVFVNNVRQEPGTAYTVSGTTLTMTGNVASTDDFYVVYQGKAIQTSVPADDTVTTAMLQDDAVTNAKIATDISNFLLPTGVILPYGGTSAPSAFLLCYGQAISRTTYAALFTAIATTYGTGDGSSTFNLPDLRGRVVAGQDDMGGSSANRLTSPINGDTLGAAGGSQSHTLTVAQTPSHSHGVYYHAGYHLAGTGIQGAGGGDSITNVAGGTTNTSGSGQAHYNMQPTIILNYIIKT